MARDITLSRADIELLREACASKDVVLRAKEGDLQTRFSRMISATHLARLGYLDAIGDGWRIKSALRPQVKAVLKEMG